MPKKEVPFQQLADFLPADTLDLVAGFLHQHKVHLTVARERKSILGDYRHRTHHDHHRISVNGNLNKFAFLITLLHELAHLDVYEQHGNRVAAHGSEWKSAYAALLFHFIQKKIFPADIQTALQSSLTNPAASSCAEDGLLRVLRKYDDAKSSHRLVEEIPLNGLFKTDDGKIFRKGEKMRKRFKCYEQPSGRVYLFSPVYEVEMV